MSVKLFHLLGPQQLSEGVSSPGVDESLLKRHYSYKGVYNLSWIGIPLCMTQDQGFVRRDEKRKHSNLLTTEYIQGYLLLYPLDRLT